MKLDPLQQHKMPTQQRKAFSSIPSLSLSLSFHKSPFPFHRRRRRRRLYDDGKQARKRKKKKNATRNDPRNSGFDDAERVCANVETNHIKLLDSLAFLSFFMLFLFFSHATNIKW